MSVDAVPSAPAARLRPAVVFLGVVIAAVQTFALGATGSIGAAAALSATALHMTGFVVLLAARRRAEIAPEGQAATADHGARLFLAGMGLAAAVFIGLSAVAEVIRPQAVTAGSVGVVAMVLASALSLIGSSVPGLRREAARHDPEAAADPSVVLVATVGLAGAAFLGAPGLDAAGAVIIAIWLAWGAIDHLRNGAR